MKLAPLIFAVCLLCAPHILRAQDEQGALRTGAAGCGKLIDEAEGAFRKHRFGSEALGAAERKLTAVLKVCPELSSQSKIKERLTIVREERAEGLFKIALYYIKKFQKGQSGSPRGGCVRLMEIGEKYPDYSGKDRALALLKESPCSELFTN